MPRRSSRSRALHASPRADAARVMRFLITGIAGFAGRHLAALLLARGDEVHGIVHRAESRARLRATSARTGCAGDAAARRRRRSTPTRSSAVVAARAAGRHLPPRRADASCPTRWPTRPRRCASTCSARCTSSPRCSASAPRCRVLAVGSARRLRRRASPASCRCARTARSARSAPTAPARRRSTCSPTSGRTAAGSTSCACGPFNHTGPGPAAGLRLSRLRAPAGRHRARRARRRCCRSATSTSVRDFSDVRDVVAAYVAAWERGAARRGVQRLLRRRPHGPQRARRRSSSSSASTCASRSRAERLRRAARAGRWSAAPTKLQRRHRLAAAHSPGATRWPRWSRTARRSRCAGRGARGSLADATRPRHEARGTSSLFATRAARRLFNEPPAPSPEPASSAGTSRGTRPGRGRGRSRATDRRR